jgi:hypothetical protein
MAKRSKSLQQAVDKINEILKNKYVLSIDSDGNLVHASSDSPEGVAFKDGVASALEVILHCHDCYRGYKYNNAPIDGKYKRHERNYY